MKSPQPNLNHASVASATCHSLVLTRYPKESHAHGRTNIKNDTNESYDVIAKTQPFTFIAIVKLLRIQSRLDSEIQIIISSRFYTDIICILIPAVNKLINRLTTNHVHHSICVQYFSYSQHYPSATLLNQFWCNDPPHHFPHLCLPSAPISV